MTLQSSGAISLDNIQTEFGGSNPASLSEYYAGGTYVPAGTTGTNGAVPSSGAISLSNFYGTSAYSGVWILVQSFSSGQYDYDMAYSIEPFTNATSDVWMCGTAGSLGSFMQKLTKEGTIAWPMAYIYDMAGRCVSVRSASEVTMSGNRPNNSLAVDLIKVDSVGSPVWGLRLQIGANGYEFGAGHFSKDSDRTYFAAAYRNGSHLSCFSDSYGSTVTRNWTKLIQNTNTNRVLGLTDSSYDGNYTPYAVGADYVFADYSDYYSIMCKFTGGTSGGALSWARALNPNSVSGVNGLYFNMINRGGNARYAIGYYRNASYTVYSGIVAKYSNAGVLQWTRVVNYTGGTGFVQGTTIYAGGSTEYVYAVFSVASAGGGQNETLIIKYDSSGTVQWQRTIRSLIGTVSYSLIMKSISRTESSTFDRLILTGTRYRTSNSDYYDPVTIKIPADGSHADGGSITVGTNQYFYYTTPTSFTSTAGSFTDLDWSTNMSVTDGVSSVTLTSVTPTKTNTSANGSPNLKGF